MTEIKWINARRKVSELIPAEKMDRKCYGMELDPKYVDVIIKRWEILTGQTAIKL